MSDFRDTRVDPELRAVLGKRITDARNACGINRNELARRLGTSWALINRWEKGVTTPSTASIRRLAAALSIPADQLLASSTDATSGPVRDTPAFAEFLRHYAPRDLTGEEQDWLRKAPTTRGPLTAEGYARVLATLRSMQTDFEGDSAIHWKVSGATASGEE